MNTNYRENNYYLHENEYFKQVDTFRFGKLLAHYECFKMSMGIPGDIVECGIFRGKSFFQFLNFRDILETPDSRKLVGFDIFGMFPPTNYEDDKQLLQDFIDASGGTSLSLAEMTEILQFKKARNYELIQGDINMTIPEYCETHKEQRISLLHIDIDVYEPCVTILNHLYDKVVGGGLLFLTTIRVFLEKKKQLRISLLEKISNCKNFLLYPLHHSLLSHCFRG